MHILATTLGALEGLDQPVDLKQPPGEIVFLSAADSELAILAQAADQLNLAPDMLRLVNIQALSHNFSVDLYTSKTLAGAKLIVLRLLGGRSYWPYGVDSISQMARENNIKLAMFPGGAEVDRSLADHSTIPQKDCELLRSYISAGGDANARNFLIKCQELIGKAQIPEPPAPMELYKEYFRSELFNAGETARVGIVFYRSVIEGGQTAPVDSLIAALEESGIAVSACFVGSLKEKNSGRFLRDLWTIFQPDLIINATSFSIGNRDADPLAPLNCQVLQVAFAGQSEVEWENSTSGLNPKDLAMNVVLPEIDGRIFTRAISFKSGKQWHDRTHAPVMTYVPVLNRVRFVADLGANWIKLRRSPNCNKRIAIVLANYPNKDGRIANGVGYDTPASTIKILQALALRGYAVVDPPENGKKLVEMLQSARADDGREAEVACFLSETDYLNSFEQLPEKVRTAIIERWGSVADDPTFRNRQFNLAVTQFGNLVVGIQPSRGYNIDPKATYHDPALVPPHSYLAFYFWLRHGFHADAIIHNGKHGNLEWLPGKATALSESCFPEIAMGPIPQIYPFIVNDPGEGTQAKRRTSAVIIDHMTPPVTRAETYGELRELEALIDEYYHAAAMDRRRVQSLTTRIFELSQTLRLDQDVFFTGEANEDLKRLDAFLCEIKEAQIRDGLHILGETMNPEQEANYLVALTRLERGTRNESDTSILRAIAQDLELEFDPLNCDTTAAWTGARPESLKLLTPDVWRTHADTIERIELFAQKLLMLPATQCWMPGPKTASVLKSIEADIRPRLRTSPKNEISALCDALAGKPVAPGPSGAPTRGRTDVLPTGRNFFSIDNRTLPTPIAWELGQKSAEALLVRHFQDTGNHLKSIALSAWGTSNMRTGGDDIAQALALMGVKPIWDTVNWRVTGFEVVPLAKLCRPRVDVTMRISGFFRDAFPAQIELLDRATNLVAGLDELPEDNPLAENVKSEAATLITKGITSDEARRVAAQRIFGSMPGAYGAGLQALIDEGIWSTRSDLAAAFIMWGAYSYGTRSEGTYQESSFRRRLASVQAVVHNQDNREHDLLDSDDYYQFEGGLSAAVETESGVKPVVYHNDHSRPERPIIRTLDEEISRVMRSRVVNPKWIAGVKRHGYKGAFEIAATVDYMFAFAATADAVKTHHFDLAYDAYIANEDTRSFIAENNPSALKEIAERFSEAISRGYWSPRSNSVHENLRGITND